MLHAFFFLVAIKWRRKIVRVGRIVSHKAARNFIRGHALFRRAIHLDAVASCQQQRFGASGLAQNVFRLGVSGEALPRINVCCVVT
jgi:hypothetical protein